METENKLGNTVKESDVVPSATDLHDDLKNCLRGLIDNTPWTYAIFWEGVDTNLPVFRWCNGYYKEEKDKHTMKPSDTGFAEQEFRKKVFRKLKLLTWGSQAPENDAMAEEVTDAEWFYLISMMQRFENGNELPCQGKQPVWIAGRQLLSGSCCERAQQSQGFGLQTVVWIPTTKGVIELGSKDLIIESTNFINEARVLFDSNNN